jgi:septal ring-binding cell division protein DamX
MRNQYGGSRTDTLIKLVLVFFLSLLSFSVGTFVGKQFSDSQHKIAELEGNSGDMDRGVASIPSDVTKADPGPAVTEEEVNKLSDAFTEKERQKDTTAPDAGSAKNDEGSKGLTGKAVGEATSAKNTSTKALGTMVAKNDNKKVSVHDEIASVSKKIAEGQKVEAPKQKPSRIPSSLPKELANSSIGKFTVQISSHPTETEAKTKANEMKEKGFSAFYIPATVNGKTWYRVSVGLFDTKKEAVSYMDKLKKDASVNSAIVQKIQK